MYKVDFDFETRSELPLDQVGIDNYARHPSTEILLCAYAFDDGDVNMWEYHESHIPEDFESALNDPLVLKYCFNASFERNICRHKLNIDIPYDEWRDVQVMSRYFSLPGSLDDVCKILQVDQDSAKLEEGKSLIRLFCEPFIEGEVTPLFGQTQSVFKDWNTNPVEWDRFKTYNKHDVLAEIAIAKKLADFPVPMSEWELWFLDQKINDRGLRINRDLLEGAIYVVEKEQEILFNELRELTKLDNPNSPSQILEWAKKEGYPFNAVGKSFVTRAINGEGGISDTCRQALILRQQASKSSVKKLYSFRNNLCEDGRIRNQFVFGGAARTLRWSGRDAQLHNLARPTKEVEKNTDKAIELLIAKDHEGIKKSFSSVLDVATSCIRPLIIPSEGEQLCVADFSSIESRVIGWVADCKRILEVYENGLDLYIDFATEMFNKPYDEITKEERNLAKPPTLGCGFQLGPGEIKINDKGDEIRTGLLGYSYAYGVEMTIEEAVRAVQVFRTKYPEIPQLWSKLDKAAMRAVKNQTYASAGKIAFDGSDPRVLKMVLPSGRMLHYAEPLIEEEWRLNKDNEEYKKRYISYMGMEQKTRQWKRLKSSPGLWTENGVQAIARDLLANGLKECDKNGIFIILHVHDEIGSEGNDLEKLIRCMTKIPDWATGLPIDAAGYVHSYYKKG